MVTRLNAGLCREMGGRKKNKGPELPALCMRCGAGPLRLYFLLPVGLADFT